MESAKGFRDSDLLTLAYAAQELYRQLAEKSKNESLGKESNPEQS